ncbi:MAG: ankyrin repeat domain-containing protein [Anaerolineae bacterium]|nr:ankyrin repeat domain-containing protein [Anaerolineae bacterium]
MNEQALFDAIKQGDQATVQSLVEQDRGVMNAKDEAGLSPVLLALYFGKTAIANLMIDAGASLSLYEATAAGRLAKVEAIIDAQPERLNEYSLDGFQALGLACFFGHLDVVTYLLSKGAIVNSASQNAMRVMPLHSAVAGDHLAIAQALIEHGANVNAIQADDFTPLHGAAQNGNLDMINLLLKHGADVHAKQHDGKQAVDFAAEAGHQAAVDLLRQRT